MSRTVLFALVVAAVGLGAACGGGIEVVPADDNTPSPPGTTPPVGRDGGGSRSDAGSVSTDAGQEKDATYTDPICQDSGPPAPQNRCDVYQQTGCRSGEGCYPFVVYPSGPCEQERYGTNCVMAGSLVTGEACGGGQRCAPGNVCVITGSGTKCMTVCRIGTPNACPEGQICSPVDVAGYAACLM